jgi:hypothetical protein
MKENNTQPPITLSLTLTMFAIGMIAIIYLFANTTV